MPPCEGGDRLALVEEFAAWNAPGPPPMVPGSPLACSPPPFPPPVALCDDQTSYPHPGETLWAASPRLVVSDCPPAARGILRRFPPSVPRSCSPVSFSTRPASVVTFYELFLAAGPVFAHPLTPGSETALNFSSALFFFRP